MQPFSTIGEAVSWMQNRQGVARSAASVAINAAAERHGEWVRVAGNPDGVDVRFNPDLRRWEVRVDYGITPGGF